MRTSEVDSELDVIDNVLGLQVSSWETIPEVAQESELYHVHLVSFAGNLLFVALQVTNRDGGRDRIMGRAREAVACQVWQLAVHGGWEHLACLERNALDRLCSGRYRDCPNWALTTVCSVRHTLHLEFRMGRLALAAFSVWLSSHLTHGGWEWTVIHDARFPGTLPLPLGAQLTEIRADVSIMPDV